MDVDDAVWEALDEVERHLRKETCEDDVVASLHCLEGEAGLFIELLARDHGDGHAQVLCPGDGVGVGAAAHHNLHLHCGGVLKMPDDVFTVGSASSDEDGKLYFFHNSRNMIYV